MLDETFKTNLAAGKPATASSAAAGHAAAVAVDGNGDTYWTPADGTIQASLEIDLGRPVTFDRAMLQEMIATGQRVERFKLEAWNGAEWKEFAQATTIGYKRLLKFPAVTASKVRLTILDARDCPDDPRVRPVQGVGRRVAGTLRVPSAAHCSRHTPCAVRPDFAKRQRHTACAYYFATAHGTCLLLLSLAGHGQLAAKDADLFLDHCRDLLFHQVGAVEPAVILFVDQVALDEHGPFRLVEPRNLGIAAGVPKGMGRPGLDLRPRVAQQRPPLVRVVRVFVEAGIDLAGRQDEILALGSARPAAWR